MAIHHRAAEAGLLHHSDQGSQYAAMTNQPLLTTHGMTISMFVGTTPVSRASSGHSSASSSTIGITQPVKTRSKTSSSTLRCSIIGSAVTRPLAMSPRPSTKRGRQLLNWVSTELGEGHFPLFATRWPISIIRPNRSSRLIDLCEVSPGLFSRARMSSMIMFSVSVSKYGSGKAVSGIHARRILRRNSVMMS